MRTKTKHLSTKTDNLIKLTFFFSIFIIMNKEEEEEVEAYHHMLDLKVIKNQLFKSTIGIFFNRVVINQVSSL